nr:response regulator [Lysinibacillus timonensis]
MILLKAVLIDDEVLGIKLLDTLLNEIGGVEVVASFTDPIEGLANLQNLQADVLFLDIEMPVITGIQIAEKIELQTNIPEIVFVTAYDQYALEAFNVEAVDYILKPLEKSRLQKTISKIARRNYSKDDELNNNNMLKAQFFGSFQLKYQQGNLVKWRTKKVKELAAYLIYNKKPIHSQQIMEVLWPNTHIDKAVTLLHSTIYQLRKVFREFGMTDAIRYKEECYSFNVEIDSDLNQLIMSAKNNNIELLLELYEADFLSMNDYVWAIQESTRIRKEVLQILEGVVFNRHYENYPTNIYESALKKLNEIEPWDERYTLKFVEYLIGQGDKKTAKDTIQKYKYTARKEFLGNESKDEEFINLLEGLINN